MGGVDGEGDVAEVLGGHAASRDGEVAGLDLVDGDGNAVGDLGEGVGGDRDADRSVGVRDEAGAVERVGALGAEDVGLAELGEGRRDHGGDVAVGERSNVDAAVLVVVRDGDDRLA